MTDLSGIRLRSRGATYASAGSVLLRVVLVILVVVVVELVRVEVLVVLLVPEGLAGEEVDRAGHDALLEVLADLVVELELLVNVLVQLVVLLGGHLGRAEEGEERVCRDRLLDDPGLVRVLVALLLGLNANSQVLALDPVDLGSDGVVVDEVALVSNLLLVEVSLLERGVAEEVLGSLGEVKGEGEASLLLGVDDADVDQELEGLLVALGDELAQAEVVLERRQPELGDSLGRGSQLVGTRLSRELALGRLGVLVLRVNLELVL